MLRVSYCLVFSLLLCFLLAGVCDGADKVRLRFQIFVLNGAVLGETALSGKFDDVWNGEKDEWSELKDSVTLFDRGKFLFGDDVLTVNEKGCFWNERSIPFEGGNTVLLPEGKVRKIYSPVFSIDQNKSSSIKIHSDRKYDYMVRRDDGLFELLSLDIPTGLDINVLLKEKKDRIYFEEMSVTLHLVGSRENVSDVLLPIGKPIVESRNYKLKLKIQEEKLYGVLLRLGGGQGFVLICFDADE